MEQTFTTGLLQTVTAFNAFLWGAPMLILIVGISVYYTWKLKLIQRHLFHAIRLCTIKDRSAGVISNFGSLVIALAAMVGTGNIVGVAAAVSTGGPGALSPGRKAPAGAVARAVFGLRDQWKRTETDGRIRIAD